MSDPMVGIESTGPVGTVTNTSAATRRRVGSSLAIDIVAVLVFVGIGRRSHDESGNAVIGALSVAAPFLIALAASWLIGRVWQRPMSARSGVIVWIVTVAVGLLLRRFVFDRGTAIAFIIVTTIPLAVLLMGWRAVARALHRDGEIGDPARR